MIALLSGVVFLLAVFSGMFGIGVAFVAVPVLSLFLPDLVNQVQPLGLFLNGVTAACSMVGFAIGGHIEWRKGGYLAVCTTLAAPLGSALARITPPIWVWLTYFVAASYVVFQMFQHVPSPSRKPQFRKALVLAVPISIVSGFLGVGPGFLLMPALVLVGFDARRAAGMNALAVTPSSFSALLPHLVHTDIEMRMAVPLAFVGATGAFFGARLAGRRLADRHLRRIFAAGIAGVTLFRAIRLAYGH